MIDFGRWGGGQISFYFVQDCRPRSGLGLELGLLLRKCGAASMVE